MINEKAEAAAGSIRGRTAIPTDVIKMLFYLTLSSYRTRGRMDVEVQRAQY